MATSTRPLELKRTYADACAGAHALDLVGERWALLVVRELIFGPKRFTDLREGLPGISPNVLSQRLQQLEQVAVLTRRRLAPPAGTWVYELTDWGRELEQVIIELGRWGARSPFHDSRAELSPDSLMLSLQTMFAPIAATTLQVRVGLRFGDDEFCAEVDRGELTVSRGCPTQPDVTVDTDASNLADVIYHGRGLSDAIDAGTLTIQGQRSALERFVGVFALPEQAPPADC